MKKTFAVIDGNSLLFRAFYALPLLEAEKGVYTNAVYGFLSMLFKMIDQYRPTHVAVAFDTREPTFRHKAFDAYKAGRKETPQELLDQFDLMRRVLDALGIRHYELPGYEADDILGTIAKRVQAQGDEALLITGDRDSFQLIGPGVRVLFTRRGITQVELLDRQALFEQFGVYPERVPDLKALMGDASDNIPGIAGVGEKTALKLLGQYDTVEGVLDHAGVIPGKLGERVRQGAQSARMSKMLATIDTDIPLDFDPAQCQLRPFTDPQAAELFQRLNFKSLLGRLTSAQAPQEAQQDAPEHVWTRLQADDAQAFEAFCVQAAASAKAAVLTGDCFSVAFDNQVITAAVRRSLIDEGLDEQDLLRGLAPLLAAPNDKVFWDKKALLEKLRPLGIGIAGAFDDVMLLEYLLDGQQEKKFYTDAAQLYDAPERCLKKLAQENMTPLYTQMERPLCDVLAQMEQEGFTIDKADLRAIGDDLHGQMRALEQVIYLQAGHPFNILSPKQLGKVLFEELGLPAGKKTKTGYSTDAQVLETLQGKHEIIDSILEYRMISKLYGTYIDGLIDKADASGRIHTTFYQTGTATGRISSADPNLQNIPVRTEQGRIIRRAFVPRDAQRLLVSADYSQIELRLLAHMSGDETFIHAFLNGEDIHARTAAEVFDVAPDQVTAQMRSAAKAVNFGIVYGISDFGLARNLGVSRKEAAGYIERFFERYPLVRAYMDRNVAMAKSEGYVQTLFGRRRYIPELKSGNHNTRAFGERVAMNAPIQGTAADIIKLAMVQVSRGLEAAALDARMILQVHDELILDAAQDQAQAAGELLKTHMQGAAQLCVPLLVSVKYANNWQDAK